MTAMNTVIVSTRAEVLRLRKWPAVWVTVSAWMALTAMFGYLFSYLAYTTGDSSFANEGASSASLLQEILPANVPNVLVQGTPMFGGALMMVLGAIVAGNGYGWGTWKTVLTQGPSRMAAMLGSLAALALFVAVTVVATLALCLGLSLLVATTESEPVVWPQAGDVAVSSAAGLLVLGMWALAGFLLGTLAKGPALSVGLGLVWALVVENLLRGVGELLGAVEVVTRFLPGTSAGSLIGSIVGVGGPDQTPGVLDTLTGPQATAVLAAYVVLLPVAALAVVNRRDVA
jgi:ABC-2 type transport system permease protein